MNAGLKMPKLTVCALMLLLRCPTVVQGYYIYGDVSTAQQTVGDYAGLYSYQIDIEWDLGHDLSHLDVVLPPCSDAEQLLLEFDSPAGYSTGQDHDAPFAISWVAQRNPGDPSIGLEGEVIMYEPIKTHDEPGTRGRGALRYYSNIAPQDETLESALVAKNGLPSNTVYGDLTGSPPSCRIVPEPAALVLFGLGAFFTLVCKEN